MSKNDPLASVEQTVIGDNNIQIAGSNNTVIQKIINFFGIDTEQQRVQRSRHTILQRVKNTWIKDILEKPLHSNLLIKLGLDYRFEAVSRPWDILLQITNQPDWVIPEETSIVQIFDELNGSLLILGEPGAGKTTTLLELARDFIERAEQNPSVPIPVVLNLSSWIDQYLFHSNPWITRFLIQHNLLSRYEKEPTFDIWLENELANKYYVTKKIAHSWIENDEVMLLLDGLDEVATEYRVSCVDAINSFRNRHGQTQVAICSRIADYEVLNTKLNLQGAVLFRLTEVA